MHTKAQIHFVFLCFMAFAQLIGCGGGGGSDDSGDTDSLLAAIVSIGAQPTNIDTGERLLVRVTIDEVNQQGIVLKLRYPQGFNFYRDSAVIIADGESSSVEPQVQGTSQVPGETADYLVFFLPRSRFGLEARGTLSLQLIGKAKVESGAIEVDVDLDNTLVDNSREFNLANPLFTPEVQVEASVAG